MSLYISGRYLVHSRFCLFALLLLAVAGCQQFQVASPYRPDVREQRMPHLSPRVSTAPLGRYHAYFGDLHNHTLISDGSGSPEYAYEYARDRAHFDFFGVSDHDWGINDSTWALIQQAADKFNLDGRYVTFRGFEWSSSAYGHVTVVGSESYCHSGDTEPLTGTFTLFSNWLEEQDGFAFFNHPGRQYRATEFDHFLSAPAEAMVGMELWNKGSAFVTYYYNEGYVTDDNNRGFFDESLLNGWKVGAAGGGDNHSASWGTAVDSRIGVLATELTRDSLTAAFRARRFYTTLDKNIILSFTADSSEMGSTVSGCTHALELQAVDGDGERFTEALLYNGNHDTVKVWSLGVCQLSVSFEYTPEGSSDYLYAKVRQEDGDEAVTSPIWFNGCSVGE